MRVAFYDCGSGNLGIQYLLAITRAQGHEPLLYFDQSFSKDHMLQDVMLRDLFSLAPERVSEGILAMSPDIVCFSMYSYLYKRNLELVRAVKRARPGIIIICGGMHPTLLPEVVLRNPEIDFAVRGEAEISYAQLLGLLAAKPVDEVKAMPVDALPGICNVLNGITVDRGISPLTRNLDQVIFPEKGLHHEANPVLKTMYTVMASRGCFSGCTYCNSATLNRMYRGCHESYYRYRSVDNVMQELLLAKQTHAPRYFEFYDDVFGANRTWLREFCARYKAEIGLPYGVQTSPVINNEESLDLLTDSGCVALEFGFQTANEEMRRHCLNRRESTEVVRRLVRYARKRGLFVELDLIVNLPGETRAHVQESRDFVMDTRPHLVNLGFLQYFPRTPITDMALQQGLLTQEDIRQIEEGERVNAMRHLSRAEVGAEYCVVPFQMYFASRFPRPLARIMIHVVEWPVVRSLSSFFAPGLLYLSRMLSGLTDRRDFFHRHQLARTFRAVRWVIRHKCLGR